MGVWSFRLFGSDHDLDILGALSDQLEVTLYIPKDLAGTREGLDDGRLTKKFNSMRTQKPVPEYRIIMLGAAAMAVGAKIEPAFLEFLTDVYPHSRLFPEGKAQMKAALEGYKNDGEAWDFNKEVVIENWMREGPVALSSDDEQ